MTGGRARPSVGKAWWGRPPNPAAAQYVYNHETIRGEKQVGLRFTFLAVALLTPRRHLMTPVITLGPIRQWTGLGTKQTRRNLDRLEELGEVKRHRVTGSKGVRYEILKLAGPLFLAPPAAKDGVIMAPCYENNIGSSWPHLPTADASPDYSSSTYVRTNRSTTTTPIVHSKIDDGEEVGARTPFALANIRAFLEWWQRTWPTHHDGAVYGRHEFIVDARAVASLLAGGRTVDRLQLMAVALWTTTSDSDPRSDRTWVATSDHSIHVLHRKARFLDLQVTRLGLAGAAMTAHWTAILERLHVHGIKRFDVDTWFTPCRLLHVTDATVTIAAPSPAHRACITGPLAEALAAALADVVPGRILEWQVRDVAQGVG